MGPFLKKKRRLTEGGKFRVSRIRASVLVFLVPHFRGSCETSPAGENISRIRWRFCSSPPEGGAGQVELPLSQASQGRRWFLPVASFY